MRIRDLIDIPGVWKGLFIKLRLIGIVFLLFIGGLPFIRRLLHFQCPLPWASTLSVLIVIIWLIIHEKARRIPNRPATLLECTICGKALDPAKNSFYCRPCLTSQVAWHRLGTWLFSALLILCSVIAVLILVGGHFQKSAWMKLLPECPVVVIGLFYVIWMINRRQKWLERPGTEVFL